MSVQSNLQTLCSGNHNESRVCLIPYTMTKSVLNFTINTSILHKFSQSHLQQSYEPAYLFPFYRWKNERLWKSDLFIVTEQRNGTARDQSGSSDPRSNAFLLIFIPLYKNKMFSVFIFLKDIEGKFKRRLRNLRILTTNVPGITWVKKIVTCPLISGLPEVVGAGSAVWHVPLSVWEKQTPNNKLFNRQLLL